MRLKCTPLYKINEEIAGNKNYCESINIVYKFLDHSVYFRFGFLLVLIELIEINKTVKVFFHSSSFCEPILRERIDNTRVCFHSRNQQEESLRDITVVCASLQYANNFTFILIDEKNHWLI